jgi:hypothetical protein
MSKRVPAFQLIRGKENILFQTYVPRHSTAPKMSPFICKTTQSQPKLSNSPPTRESSYKREAKELFKLDQPLPDAIKSCIAIKELQFTPYQYFVLHFEVMGVQYGPGYVQIVDNCALFLSPEKISQVRLFLRPGISRCIKKGKCTLLIYGLMNLCGKPTICCATILFTKYNDAECVIKYISENILLNHNK